MEVTLEELRESAEATQRAFSILFVAATLPIIIWNIKRFIKWVRDLGNPDKYEEKAKKEAKEAVSHSRKAVENKLLAKIIRKIKGK